MSRQKNCAPSYSVVVLLAVLGCGLGCSGYSTKRLTDFPSARDGLVDELLASALLQQYVDENHAMPRPATPLAEAFYLLGIAEARSLGSFWEPTSEFHLEMAIRLDPSSLFAADALSVLKKQLEFAYGGSSGVHLPADVQSTLRELEGLIKDKSPKR